MTENREALDVISEYLYEHETITGKEFMKLFREVKGIPDPEEEKKDSNDGQKDAKEEHLSDEMFEDELPKGSFVDQTVTDDTNMTKQTSIYENDGE